MKNQARADLLICSNTLCSTEVSITILITSRLSKLSVQRTSTVPLTTTEQIIFRIFHCQRWTRCYGWNQIEWDTFSALSIRHVLTNSAASCKMKNDRARTILTD